MKQWYNSDGTSRDHARERLHARRRQLEDRQRRAPLRGHGLREDLRRRATADRLRRVHRHRGLDFRDDIVWMAEQGITTGCSTTSSAPMTWSIATRWRRFLRRAEHLPVATHDWFTDDATNPHQDSINRVADAGIARGVRDESVLPEASDHAGPDGRLPGRRPELAARRPATSSPTTTTRRTRPPSTASPRPGITSWLRAESLLPGAGRDPRADGRIPSPGVRLSRGLPVESAAT